MKKPANPVVDPLVGATLGRYSIQSRIGEGGMGAVYRAEQRPLGRAVALKVIHAGLASDKRIVGRFMREARIACQLTNPHTVTIFDFGNEGEQLYLAMELLKGESLQARLSRGPIEPVRAAEIAAQVCRSLSEAHRNRIIHRDLKPDNIFLCSADDASLLVKVLDYGLARIVASDDAPHSPLGTLTQVGSIVGTPTYMSPEQARSRPLDIRTDLYSMGVVLFEMLTGVPPFDDQDAIILLGKHLREPPPRLSSVGAFREAPEALQVLVDKLLEKEPGRRPPDAAWVYQELRAYQRSQPGWDDRVGLRARETTEDDPASAVLHLPPIQAAGLDSPAAAAAPTQTPPEPTEPAPFRVKAHPVMTPADPQTEPWPRGTPGLLELAGQRRPPDSSDDSPVTEAETDRAPGLASFAAAQDPARASGLRQIEAPEPEGGPAAAGSGSTARAPSDLRAPQAPSRAQMSRAWWRAKPKVVLLALVGVSIAVGGILIVQQQTTLSPVSSNHVVRPSEPPARVQAAPVRTEAPRAAEGRAAPAPSPASRGDTDGLVPRTPARWSGVWASNRGTVVLRELRSEVTGTFGREGRVVGRAQGADLRLRWSTQRQAGRALVRCYADAVGRLELRGTWGIGDSDSGGGAWTGALTLAPRTTTGRRQPGRRNLIVPNDEIFGGRRAKSP